jgi:hypothetical protein
MRHLPKAQVQRLARAKAERRARRRAQSVGLRELLAKIAPPLATFSRDALYGAPWIVTQAPLPHGRVLITLDCGYGPDTSWVALYHGYPYRPWLPRRMRKSSPLKG